MSDEPLQTLIQYGAGAFVVLFVLVVLMVIASTTDLGRAMLPDAVNRALSRLLPNSWINEVRVTGPGLFELRVQGAVHLKTVHVRHADDRTIAWTFDPETRCPQSGTFSIAEFDHDIGAAIDSPMSPERVQSRIAAALEEALLARGFLPVEHSEADILVCVVIAIDHALLIDNLQSKLDDGDNGEWKAAIRTAMQHDGVRNPIALAKGSLLLSLVDAASQRALWRAAALGEFVIDVSERERERRIRLAVSEMLNSFPPKPIQPPKPEQ